VVQLGGAAPRHGYEAAIDAKEQRAMNPADRALIVVHRDWRVAAWYRCRVSIDGRPAEDVARGRSTEFPIDPGVHTVEAAIDWSHPPALRLEVAPGSRTDLRIAGRPWSSLKFGAPLPIILFIVLPLINRPLAGLVGLFSAWLISLGLVLAAILIPALLVKDFWVLWNLELVSEPVSESPSTAAV
jgi:hypothetical protein